MRNFFIKINMKYSSTQRKKHEYYWARTTNDITIADTPVYWSLFIHWQKNHQSFTPALKVQHQTSRYSTFESHSLQNKIPSSFDIIKVFKNLIDKEIVIFGYIVLLKVIILKKTQKMFKTMPSIIFQLPKQMTQHAQ